jgi:DNA repair protein RecO (recombination protein O)
MASLLQPFQPLLISLVGRSELKAVRQVESASVGYRLRGDALMSGLYLNELLTRVLPRFDVMPELFAAYGRAIDSLNETAPDQTLRRFELSLLTSLGYQINWVTDDCGEPIQLASRYRYESERGFCGVPVGSDRPGEVLLYTGEQIASFARWSEADAPLSREALQRLKGITRIALSQLMAGRALHTRSLFRGLKQRQGVPELDATAEERKQVADSNELLGSSEAEGVSESATKEDLR